MGGGGARIPPLTGKTNFADTKPDSMAPIRITQLEIHQIGPFGDLTLDFPPKPAGMEDKAEIHILTGENGTGKTTVLEMLAAVFRPEYDFRKGRYLDDRSYFCFKSDDTILRYVREGLYHPEKGNSLTRAVVSYQQSSFPGFNIPYSIASFAYSGLRSLSEVHIEGISEIKEHPFKDALDFKKSVSPQLLLQWIANTIASEAIAKTTNPMQPAIAPAVAR